MKEGQNAFELNLDSLELDKETIAKLDEAQLQEIVGGADDAVVSSCGSGNSCSGGASCTQGGTC